MHSILFGTPIQSIVILTWFGHLVNEIRVYVITHRPYMVTPEIHTSTLIKSHQFVIIITWFDTFIIVAIWIRNMW